MANRKNILSARQTIRENNENKNSLYSSTLTDVNINNEKVSVSTDNGKTFKDIGVSATEFSDLSTAVSNNSSKIEEIETSIEEIGTSNDNVKTETVTLSNLYNFIISKKFDNIINIDLNFNTVTAVPHNTLQLTLSSTAVTRVTYGSTSSSILPYVKYKFKPTCLDGANFIFLSCNNDDTFPLYRLIISEGDIKLQNLDGIQFTSASSITFHKIGNKVIYSPTVQNIDASVKVTYIPVAED